MNVRLGGLPDDPIRPMYNFKPHHLAVLIDNTGACSVEDGAGVNNAPEGSARLWTPRRVEADECSVCGRPVVVNAVHYGPLRCGHCEHLSKLAANSRQAARKAAEEEHAKRVAAQKVAAQREAEDEYARRRKNMRLPERVQRKNRRKKDREQFEAKFLGGL